MADGITILPTRDRFAGLRVGSQNLVQGLIQQQQQRQAAQQLQQLGFPAGLTSPIAQTAAIQQGLQRQQIAGRAITPPTIAGLRAAEAARTGVRPGTPEFERIAAGPIKPTAPVSGSFQQIADPVTGRQINALVNPRTGNIIRKFGTIEEGLSTKDKVQVAVTQAKEFRADPRIKNFQIIERSERGMQAALKQATSPNVKSRIASDQALGVLFQKMLDPESVVRESEFARTPEGAAIINQLLAIFPKLKLGGLKLLNKDRRALVSMAQKLLNGAKISANRAFDEFSTRADVIGLNKKIVFGGAKKFDVLTEEGVSTGQIPQTIPFRQTATNPETGKRIESFDGGKTWQPIR